MSELVLEVSKDARTEKLHQLLHMVAVIPAFFLTIYVEVGVYIILLFPILWAVSFLLIKRIVFPMVKFSEAPEAIITISADGIHIIWHGGKVINIKWNEIVCVDIHFSSREKMLRIAPLQRAFIEIQYHEEHFALPLEEIMTFIHEVCPYGKDISFWNEHRQ